MSRVLVLLLALLVVGGVWWLLGDLPGLSTLPERLNTPSVRIVDRNGRLLYESLPEVGGRHTVVSLQAVAPACRQATIAVEDRNFYSHPGVDLSGILRALWINLQAGDVRSGGSTITQQVARTVLLDAGERGERSLRRKLREAYLAIWLTRRFSKDEILALYLNQTYYGGMAYGIEAASQTFFGKPAARLDLAECALLVGLPQAPSVYNPFTDPEAARKRQAVVLGLMVEAGQIDAETQAQAQREPLVFAETPYPMQAPHFVMMARAEVDRLFSPEQVYAYGGLTVRTTLDLDWQRLAEAAIERQLKALSRSEDGLGHNVNNAALTVLDPRNGQVLVLVGSRDYFDIPNSGAINMALTARQPGSALKPIIYAAALDPLTADGAPWTAATMLLDIQTGFQTRDGQAYTPTNYNFAENGPVLLRTALGSSLNIPAVLTLQHVGTENTVRLAQRLGISTLDNPAEYDLSLALGGGKVSLLDLTAAYAAFANRGQRVQPQILLSIESSAGEILYTAPTVSGEQVLDGRTAWLISDILSDDDARLLGFGRHSLLQIDRPAAVKTGTTSNYHDNWTIGYTPDLVVGVWAGNATYAPMREVDGLSGAGPIWHQFIRAALAGRPSTDFPRPDGLVQVTVCSDSGLLPTPACPYRREEWFISGTEPTRPDTLHRTVVIDVKTGLAAGSDTPAEQQRSITAWDLPPGAVVWARDRGLPLYGDLMAAAPVELEGGSPDNTVPALPATEESADRASQTLQWISPAAGATYRLDPALSAEMQRISLTISAPLGVKMVRFYIDGVEVGQATAPPFKAWWSLQVGEHRLWAEAILPDGKRLQSSTIVFVVL